jgi:hypothetical protein
MHQSVVFSGTGGQAYHRGFDKTSAPGAGSWKILKPQGVGILIFYCTAYIINLTLEWGFWIKLVARGWRVWEFEILLQISHPPPHRKKLTCA